MRTFFRVALLLILFLSQGLSSELEVERNCSYAANISSSYSPSGKGVLLKCRVRVKNVSPYFLKSVKVKVFIPRRVRYLSGSGNPVFSKEREGVYVIWTIPHLAPAEEKVFYYKLRVER